MLKPVILMTVYRRYNELRLSLEKIKSHFPEVSEKPDVVIFWAAPEVGHLWFFQELKEAGLYTHLLTREFLPEGDGTGSTTYPESNNIRKGLDFIKLNYNSKEYYAIVQAADINVKLGTYGLMHTQINLDDQKVFLYRWPNPVTLYAWHTNLFAVVLDERYWPPVVTSPKEQSVLEHKWGTYLGQNNLQGLIMWNNEDCRWFYHGYTNIDNTIPTIAQKDNNSISLHIVGTYKSRIRRLLQKLAKSVFGVNSF